MGGPKPENELTGNPGELDEDFDCPHCGKRFVCSEYRGEVKTVGSIRRPGATGPSRPHVVCSGCKKCCGCLG